MNSDPMEVQDSGLQPETEGVSQLLSLMETLRIVAKYVDPQKSYCYREHGMLLLPLPIHAVLHIADEERLLRLGAIRATAFDCWALPM